MNRVIPARRRSRILDWFDPRGRQPGTWAFILNRLSAIGLTAYLFIHLVVLGQLARGPQAYDNFIALAKSPLFIAGELLVVIGGLYHGLNGLRVALTSFGVGVRRQQWLFFGVALVVGVVALAFGMKMFR